MLSIRFLTILFISSLYIWVAPYTKVEESFSLQAIHDFIYHRSSHGSSRLSVNKKLDNSSTSGLGDGSTAPRFIWDHEEYPGPVPRTFIGPAIVGLLTPRISDDKLIVQLTARFMLCTLFAIAFRQFERAFGQRFGQPSAKYLFWITISQFSLLFYASRPLPNTFALIMVLFALSAWLSKRYPTFITLTAFTVVIFRIETCLLFGPILITSLFHKELSFKRLLGIGIPSGLLALALTVLIDSHMWGHTVYPEGYGFYFNIYLNKSKDWGTLPFHWYFTNGLPKALGTITVLLPLTRGDALRILGIPSLVFIGLYSFLPHKELRFIFYCIPLLNACCACNIARLFGQVEGKLKRDSQIGENSVKSKNSEKIQPYVEQSESSIKTRLRKSTRQKTLATEAVSKVQEPQEQPKDRSSKRTEKRSSLTVFFYIIVVCLLMGNIGATLIRLLVSHFNYPGGQAVRFVNQRILSYDSSEFPSNKIGIYVSNLAAQSGFSRFLQLNDIYYDKSPDMRNFILNSQKLELSYFIVESHDSNFLAHHCSNEINWTDLKTDQSESSISCRPNSIYEICSLRNVLHADSPLLILLNAVEKVGASNVILEKLRDVGSRFTHVTSNPILWVFDCKSRSK
ncbi:dol-P-Man:Man(7)GlcNAc(2)-PP-Dol alpha-1,6-mannosyltransferase-like isoform X1 [Brevipalpus obovatus]|uniref:dol-P-Man:Man(7)GlcNAc(2)-PP-Dol alpha-1,6-mannosyltransferase-like isoform X1 n=1 Tax=Brevipalpus obovatus TaxID=246614 RepID=UPI003D9F3058